MKRFLLITMLALIAPTAALAKGASEATIEGPGLDGTVVIPGDGEGGGTTLGRLVELSGFFPSVFEQTPNPMLDTKPDVELGPRYIVRYVMPGPEGQTSILEQELYPYARPYPVSYTKPGQPFWGATSQDAAARRDGQHTYGGWYVSTAELTQTLGAIGLPASAPSAHDDGFWTTPSLIGVIAGVGAAVLALAVLIRRTGRRDRNPHRSAWRNSDCAARTRDARSALASRTVPPNPPKIVM
jgi:hypothetical protein